MIEGFIEMHSPKFFKQILANSSWRKEDSLSTFKYTCGALEFYIYLLDFPSKKKQKKKAAAQTSMIFEVQKDHLTRQPD